MSVFRTYCVAVGLVAAVAPGTSNCQSIGNELQLQRAENRQEIVRQTEIAVLRQKVSMPLDRLAQPVSLAEWQNAATIAPRVSSPVVATTATRELQLSAPAVAVTEHSSATVSAVAATANPFADDPAPQAEGKIPSGKLMGIVGRALFEAAPVPSLEDVREHLPNVPIPGTGGTPPAADDSFDTEPGFAPTDESDPFAEPATIPASEEGSSETTAPEEDPFG